MNKAPVTVIMSTFNRAYYIEEALNGIINQSLPPSQIIVVNDGSTDNTSEILKKYKDKITYFEQHNSGKSVAINFALKYATEEYIWIFDDDDIPFDDALKNHINAINENPGIDFTYSPCVLLFSDENNQCHETQDSLLPDVDDNNLYYIFLDYFFLYQQGCLLKRTSVNAIGNFREDYLRSLDYEFMLRFVRKHKGIKLNKPTFYLRVHSGKRGNKDNIIDSNMRAYAWYQNDKKIFQELHASLGLEEYLPKETGRQQILLSERNIPFALLNSTFRFNGEFSPNSK